MTIDIVPARDRMNPEEGVSMDDRAFFILEYFLPKTWAVENRYDHCGKSVLDKINWSSWYDAIKAFSTDEASMRRHGAAIMQKYPELKADLSGEISAFEAVDAPLTSAFCKATALWGEKYREFHIFGL